MFDVLPKLNCLASVDSQTAAALIIGLPVFVIAIISFKIDQKKYKQGTIKGVRPSNNLFDWFFRGF
ncbi:hypothetical protein DRO61_07960 [Candidatus Bathyarchaeota archaeon]|nr:MAG: hypothetical protein DRO61_07960 [Candidatus Bathyarchaeota archaeon]